jgi:hypothetical protein
VTQHFRPASGEGSGRHQGARRSAARSGPGAACNRARGLMRQAEASVVRYTTVNGVAVGLPRGDR